MPTDTEIWLTMVDALSEACAEEGEDEPEPIALSIAQGGRVLRNIMDALKAKGMLNIEPSTDEAS